MAAIFWAVPLGILAFAVHVLIWRASRPRNSGVALLAVFVVVGMLGGGAFLLWGWHSGTIDWLAGAQTLLLYLAGMAAYINTYPAIEADSPSLVLMQELRRAGEKGMSRAGIHQMFNDEVVFTPRVLDLVNENMAIREGDHLRLTAKGWAIARIFGTFRRLTGRPRGG
jgi:hypothetical protein